MAGLQLDVLIADQMIEYYRATRVIRGHRDDVTGRPRIDVRSQERGRLIGLQADETVSHAAVFGVYEEEMNEHRRCVVGVGDADTGVLAAAVGRARGVVVIEQQRPY